MPAEPNTTILGIVIPSTDPVFLGAVGLHVLAGLGCVSFGLAAMLLTKKRGRHSTAGTIYFWCLSMVFATAAALAYMRWAEDRILFFLGALSFGLAVFGRYSARQRRNLRLHAISMGLSYIVLLTAFYVDNGKNLPVWRDLPAIAYWTVPALVGVPIILWALARHPLLRRRGSLN